MPPLSDAQQAQVDALRPLVGEWDGDDDSLYALLAAADGDVNLAASQGWAVKSASAGSLVDVQEGSSKRPLSQLAPAARVMSEWYQARSTAGAGVSVSGATARRIVRP